MWRSAGSGPVNPQDLNRYAYALNNPLTYTDPTGHWVESAIDIAFIASDLWDIAQNGLTRENGLALAADVGGLLLPGLTGGGMLVRVAARIERFAGASPAIRQGVERLAKIVENPNVPAAYRHGLAMQLKRAEMLYAQGKLHGVEVLVEGGRVDFVLVTDELVEFKYWTQKHTDTNIDRLANQLKRYQASGRPIILELGRTKTDPITEAYLDKLLKELQGLEPVMNFEP